ncbi:pyridoxamine 5'-phosphate oxidase [Roseimarinus sediminis]|uniref:pyridoxamine 5'-phosphate oxidase n=1 Tax=Roseimarinus sediminis TaxID=1610899 RepID=UPI003D21C08D
MDLSEIRSEYQQKTLEKKSVDTNPLRQLEIWLNEAKAAQCSEYTAMTIATTGENMQPSIRVVLLKYLKDDGLYFFTNYESRKGKDLEFNKKIAAHFFWPELERQVKIEGTAIKAPAEISDFYFQSRPHESRLSAVVSKQSSEIEDRQSLEKLWKEASQKWEGKTIERPGNWGGYVIKPSRMEFWQGRPFRLHDRIAYKKSIDGWWLKRLAP